MCLSLRSPPGVGPCAVCPCHMGAVRRPGSREPSLESARNPRIAREYSLRRRLRRANSAALAGAWSDVRFTGVGARDLT